MEMKLQKEGSGYKFYSGFDDNAQKFVYNILPSYQTEVPTTGYYDREYIEKVKGVKF